MSDQPDSNTGTSSVSAAALRDTRWLAGGIWGGLLLALVVTSVYGINSFTQGSLASRYLGLPLQNASPNEKVAAAVGMIASGVAALILLAAWRSFATMTNVLVGALAGSSDAAEIRRRRPTGFCPISTAACPRGSAKSCNSWASPGR